MKEKKKELIKGLKGMGLPTKRIALIVYKDSSEKGQKKVRAILSRIQRRELELKTGLKNHKLAEFLEFESMIQTAMNNKSLMRMLPTLRKKKTLASGLLYGKLPLTIIALMLYGSYGKSAKNKVYAHISKFSDIVKELREVAVANFTNKSCDLQNFIATQPQTQVLNLKSATLGNETETATIEQAIEDTVSNSDMMEMVRQM